MLTGLFGPTRGEALINGYRISDEIHKIHKTIGVCPQFDLLWLNLTCRETLLFYARLKGMREDTARAAVDASLADVELDAAGNKRVSELSGGMRRRLSIAVALLGSPEMCVFDEPTTGLGSIVYYVVFCCSS
jgi:ABC-type multidrug transport system ATPase subunit